MNPHTYIKKFWKSKIENEKEKEMEREKKNHEYKCEDEKRLEGDAIGGDETRGVRFACDPSKEMGGGLVFGNWELINWRESRGNDIW